MLSLDATLGVILVITLLIAADVQMRHASEDSLSSLSVAQFGGAATATLDKTGVLATRDAGSIEAALTPLLQANVAMRIAVMCDGGTNLATSATIPSKQFIASGKRYFVVTSGNSIDDRCAATWWAWTR
jgi:hypothetical protein